MNRSRRHSRAARNESWQLKNARSAFELLTRGPRPLTLDCPPIPGLPDGPLRLDDLRDRLLDRDCPQQVRDAVWARLVERARDDGGAWRTACLGMALPGLIALTLRLAARFKVGTDEVASEVFYGFMAAVPVADTSRVGISARLQWAAFAAAHEALRRSLDGPTPIGDGFVSQPPTAPWGHPDFVLARAITAGVLTPGEADLIGATRLEHVPVADYATEHGTGLTATYQRRQRAERRLVAWLLTATTVTPTDDPVPSQFLATHPTGTTSPPSMRSLPVADIRGLRRKRTRTRVSKTDPESRVLQCGDLPPSPKAATPPESTPEERRCA